MELHQTIVENINNPATLEQLYRQNPKQFSKAFDEIFTSVADNPIAQSWHERLHYVDERSTKTSTLELIAVIIGAFISGALCYIISRTDEVDESVGFINIVFSILSLLAIWHLYVKQVSFTKSGFIMAAFLIACIYINVLPHSEKSATSTLAVIHMPLFLWTLIGLAFVNDKFRDIKTRVRFLEYSGDFAIMTGLLLAIAMIFGGLTLFLLGLANENYIEKHADAIFIWLAAACPAISAYLIEENPQLINKVGPTIAKIFTPLSFVVLTIFLVLSASSGENPYTDRDFLMTCNIILIIVITLILFSISGQSENKRSLYSNIILLLLSAVTLILNLIAISAIIFRMSEFGLSPNRIAVLGGNILMLSNLCLITYHLIQSFRNRSNNEAAINSIGWFIPFYCSWAAIVTFLFPLLFWFR